MNPAQTDMNLVRANAVRLSLFFDLASIAPVLIIAVVVNSLSLYADCLTYINNIAANLIGWLTLRRIAQGKSVFYDYGLGKLENLTSLVCSLIILAGLMGIVYFSIGRILNPQALDPELSWLGVGQHLIDFSFSAWLWRRNYRIARQQHSPLMETQWRTNCGDAMQSIGIILTLTLSMLLHDYLWAAYLDPICAIAIAIAVLITFLRVIRGSIGDILDHSIEDALQIKIIRSFTQYFDEYENIHAIRTRRAGGQIFIDVDIELSPVKTVADALDTLSRLCCAIRDDIPQSTVRIALVGPGGNLPGAAEERTS